MSCEQSFIALATSGAVARRALGYAVVVGGILIAINHGDALLVGDVDASRVWKLILTPMVPYAVSTLSSVSALRAVGQARRAGSAMQRARGRS